MGAKSVYLKTLKELEQHAEENEAILIGFSGGKDSLVVLDLCVKVFKRVVCFYMYIVPGLQVVERQLKWAEDRYGVPILQYPHWLLSRFFKQGVYCDPSYRFNKVPELRMRDIFALVRNDTGIWLIALGWKKTDTLWRRRNMAHESPGVIHPIRDWNKYEVLAYCKMNNIQLPDAAKGRVSGIDLSEKTLLWLHERHPEDFKKLLKVFPYAEVPIYRRKFYGQELPKINY